MAEFLENFSYYGGDVNRMLDGRWSALGSDIEIAYPAFDGDTSKAWLRQRGGIGTRRTYVSLPSPSQSVIVSERIHYTNLSEEVGDFRAITMADENNNVIFYIRPSVDGKLHLHDGSGTTLSSSSGQVIFAGTSHHLEVFATSHATLGEVEVRVDGNTVIHATGLALSGEDFAIFNIYRNLAHGLDMYITDLWIRNVTGGSDSRNEDFINGSEIATLRVVGDTDANHWSYRARKGFGDGILDLRNGDTRMCVYANNSSDFDVGSNDFEFTTWIRFHRLPTGSREHHILSKWDEGSNNRSFRLFLAGPDIGGGLVFQCSTDGTAGGVKEIFNWPWEPERYVWYAVSVQRSSGVTRLFIAEKNKTTGKWDFVEHGDGFADANTYFNSSSRLSIGAKYGSSNTSVDGFIDETRLTIGAARNTSEYTLENEPLPRGGDDPHWPDVVLIMGYDSEIGDESSHGRSMYSYYGASVYTPDDGQYAYQSIEHLNPRDDTFIEAALIPAMGVLSFSGNPTDGDTVTIGTTTYTFVTALDSSAGPADAVVIGADAEESRDNLISAINGDSGAGTVYGVGTVTNPDVYADPLPSTQIQLTASSAGTGGNSIATTETSSVLTFENGSTLTGGQDIPDASEYVLSRLPRDAARVFSAQIIAREYKSASGPAATQAGFVDVFGSVDMGSAQNLTNNPVYRVKHTITSDPTSGGVLTPSTFVNAKVRINRTE